MQGPDKGLRTECTFNGFAGALAALPDFIDEEGHEL
jgi:hypothetical protein